MSAADHAPRHGVRSWLRRLVLGKGPARAESVDMPALLSAVDGILNTALERERAFREHHAHLVKAETHAFIEQRLNYYFGFRQPIVFPDKGRVMVHTNDGHRLYLDTSEPFIAFHLIENGEWERHVHRAIRALLPVGGIFVDIGANIGIHTVLACSVVGPGGRILALEPHPRIRELLRDNLEINSFLERVDILPFAVSDTSGKFVDFEDFLDHPAMSGFKVSTQRRALFQARTETITVETKTVDDLVRPLGFKADLVKIDVEGFEGPVVQGCAELISNNTNVAFIIEHEKVSSIDVLEGRTADVMAELFSAHGFLVFELRHDGSPRPLTYDEFRPHGGGDFVFVHPTNPRFEALSEPPPG